MNVRSVRSNELVVKISCVSNMVFPFHDAKICKEFLVHYLYHYTINTEISIALQEQYNECAKFTFRTAYSKFHQACGCMYFSSPVPLSLP
jgi:hypothetical protein